MPDPTVAHLHERISCLEADLRARPTKEQIDYVTEYAERRNRLYEAVLARNVILRDRLNQATKK